MVTILFPHDQNSLIQDRFQKVRRVVKIFIQFLRAHAKPAGTAIIVNPLFYLEVQVVIVPVKLPFLVSGSPVYYRKVLPDKC
jgi:hypothetical protein